MNIRESEDGTKLIVWIPMNFCRRGGRKRMVAPGNSELQDVIPHQPPDASLIRALGNAHRWLALLESGEVKSISALAKQEGIDKSNLGKMLNLTCLAPDIKKAILDGTQPEKITPSQLRKTFPIVWEEQREFFSMPAQ
ncbi:hypothetical protein ACQZV8_11765 [Magnetococcales bacterium HHB-1]